MTRARFVLAATLVASLTAACTSSAAPKQSPAPSKSPAPPPKPASTAVTSNLSEATGGGQYADAPGLDPVAIKTAGMQVAWKTKITGEPYAQPVRVNNTVIEATEENHVTGIDLRTGSVRWDVQLGTPWLANNLKFSTGQDCPDLQPDVGITGTPVVDPDKQLIYLTSKQADPRNPHLGKIYVYAIRATDGSIAWKTEISGAANNVLGAVFDPTTANQRSGLTYMDGHLYFTTSSHCTIGPYRGWVIGVDAATHQLSAKWTSDDLVGTEKFTNGGNGIWMGGGPPTSDGSGRLFVSIGNGPAPDIGADSSLHYGMSVVRFQVQPNGQLAVADFYSPTIANVLNVSDSDLGTSPYVLLPSSFGTPTHPSVGVAVDKTTRVSILDDDDLGQRTDPDSALQVLGPYTYGSKQQTAVYDGDGGWFYVIDNTGVHAFTQVGATITDAPLVEQEGVSGPEAGIGIAPAQGSVAVSSDQKQSGTGIVWVVGRNIPAKDGGHLLAFGAVPVNGKLPLLWQSPVFQGMKFARPLIANNLVVVGEYNGYLTAYKANSTSAGPNFRTASVTFGRTPIGTSVTHTIDLLPRAGKSGGIRSVSSNDPQITLKRTTGDILDVTYTPTKVGMLNTAFKAVTLGGVEAFTISAQGIPAGGLPVAASPASETFAPTVHGLTAQQQLELSNDSDQPVTVTSVTTAAPFSVPRAGGHPVIAAHGKLGIAVTFSPTGRGAANGSLAVRTSAGAVTVPLAGVGTDPGHLVISGRTFTLPPTKVGQTSSVTFTLQNTGEGELHFSKAKEPDGDFSDAVALSEGTTIGPGQTLTHTVTFAPTKTGTETSGYALDVDDDSTAGTRSISFTGVGVP